MKKIIFLLFVCLASFSGQAQEIYNSSGRKVAKKPAKKTGFDRDKLVLGGDLRFSGGNGFISVGVAPVIGYKLMERLYGGVKLGYSYDRYKVDRAYLPMGTESNILSYNTYSGGLWGRFLLWESIYIHSELEYNIFDNYFQDDLTGLLYKKKVESPSLLIGAGLRQPITDRLSLNLSFLFDVLNDPNSYYKVSGKGGLDIRMGVLIGF